MEQSTSLYTKLARIMGEMSGLQKRGKNAHFGYNFITADDVMNDVRARLADHNVAFLASMADIEQTSERKQGKSGERVYTHTRVRFEFTFIDGDTGETRSSTWYGESDDDADKGINKAATAAVKYFLMRTFMIHTPDMPDPDADRSYRRQAQQAPAQQRQQPAPQASGDNPQPPRPELANRNTAGAFIEGWRAQGVTDVDVLAALGVSRLSEYQGTRAQADQTVSAWIEQQLATPPAQPMAASSPAAVAPVGELVRLQVLERKEKYIRCTARRDNRENVTFNVFEPALGELADAGYPVRFVDGRAHGDIPVFIHREGQYWKLSSIQPREGFTQPQRVDPVELEPGSIILLDDNSEANVLSVRRTGDGWIVAVMTASEGALDLPLSRRARARLVRRAGQPQAAATN